MLEIYTIVPSVQLLHGAGAGGDYDEAILFIGIGLVLACLAYLAWRSGKKKDKRNHKRKGTR